MRRLAPLPAALALALALAAPAGAAPYVVTFAPGVADPVAATTGITKRLGVSARHRYAFAIKGFAADLTTAQAGELRRSAGISAVVADTTFTAAGLGPLAPGEAVPPPGVRRVEAATRTAVQGAADGAVAVLDTGIDLAHPDLAAVSGTNCLKPGAAAQDDGGHGTHVAGIVGARNQGAGVTGVAPGTRLYAVKVLGSTGKGTLSSIVCGLDWLARNAAPLGIRVATMSLAGAGRSDGACGSTSGDAQHKAICAVTAAGVAVVAAAGNATADIARTVPAAYPEVLTATAMSDTDGLPGATGPAPGCSKGARDDTVLAASNFAVADADRRRVIAAPGTCVLSTAKGGGTGTYTGTSQAAPHVAGVVALCFGSGGVAGPCEGLAPQSALAKVRSDALAAATTANGFAGDPTRPVTGRHYGPLVRVR